MLEDLVLPLVEWANNAATISIGAAQYITIPDFFLIDFILAGYTLFHTFVALSYVAVSDASYKKSLVALHRKIAKTFYDIPFLVNGATVGLTILAAHLCYQVYQQPEDSSALTLRAVVAVNTWVCSIILQKLSNSLVKLGVDYTMQQEQEVEKHDIADWTPPPRWWRHLLAPQNWLLRPQIFGKENIPTSHPSLYVSNHSLMGLEMAPFVEQVWTHTGVFMRGLADHIHFGQLHGELFRAFGCVDGTRDNVDVLMETKQNVLVYPGGGHEIMKPTSVPKYTLMWKERLGFVRMAIKHGYPIVPCCSVGTEDMMDRLWDINASFLKRGMKMPFVVIPPHKLQRVYFWFGKPIPTAQYHGDWQNDEICREVRDKVKAAVEAGIWEMKQQQSNDPNRYLLGHIRNTIMSCFSGSPASTMNDDDSVEDSLASTVQPLSPPRSSLAAASNDDEDAWEPILPSTTTDDN